MRDHVLIWSQLTRSFHPVCFIHRTSDYLLAKTEEVEPCGCFPDCNCQHEEDFAAGLRAGAEELYGSGVVN